MPMRSSVRRRGLFHHTTYKQLGTLCRIQTGSHFHIDKDLEIYKVKLLTRRALNYVIFDEIESCKPWIKVETYE